MMAKYDVHCSPVYGEDGCYGYRCTILLYGIPIILFTVETTSSRASLTHITAVRIDIERMCLVDDDYDYELRIVDVVIRICSNQRAIFDDLKRKNILIFQ